MGKRLRIKWNLKVKIIAGLHTVLRVCCGTLGKKMLHEEKRKEEDEFKNEEASSG